MSRADRGMRRLRGIIALIGHHRVDERPGGTGGFKDLSALPVCGAGVRPSSAQRQQRTA